MIPIGTITKIIAKNWKPLLTALGIISGTTYVTYKFYTTSKAKAVERQFSDLHTQYKGKKKTEFKKAAEKIYEEIKDFISNQTIPTKEKEELQDILKRHSEWVYA